MVMNGVGQYIGVNGFFRMLEDKSYKTHYRVMLSRYRGYTRCRSCNGSRLAHRSPSSLCGQEEYSRMS